MRNEKLSEKYNLLNEVDNGNMEFQMTSQKSHGYTLGDNYNTDLEANFEEYGVDIYL